MPGSEKHRGRKGPGRVEVIYFPKRAASARRPAHADGKPDPSESRTIEFRPFAEEEVPTPSRGRSRRKKTPEASPRRTRSGERRKKQAEQTTDPELRYQAQKLEELARAPTPTGPLRAMSQMEHAQMAVFGHQLFESGQLEAARVVFEGLVGLELKDAFPHTMLGTVYLALEKKDRAAALFQAALDIDPEDTAARVYLAEIDLNRGRIRPAVEVLKKVIADADPEDPFVDRARRLLEIVGRRQRRRR